VDTFRLRPAAIGRSRSAYLASVFGRELRVARMTTGLTQMEMSRLAGVSQQEASRAELGAGDVSLDARCRMAAACGHELGWRLYPVATVRLRDSGQLTLAQAIVGAAHASWEPHLEVPVAPGDARAADLILVGPAEILHIEVERALVDFQAQLRSAQLKRQAIAERHERQERQQPPVRLILAVPDSRTSRARLAPFEDLISRTLPADSRAAWRAIRSGGLLGSDGILFVRAVRRG
jgi:transcriptional regulator with XRE-family HTH domain